VIYLYSYLGIGALILLIMYVSHKLSTKSESEGVKGILDALNPERGTLSYRLINGVLVPILASVLVLLPGLQLCI